MNHLLPLALVAVLLFASAPARAGTAQSGYVDSLFCDGVSQPTAIAVAPDGTGRLFVSVKSGAIGVIPPTGGAMSLFVRPSPVFSQVECGVLGLCFDPNFTVNHFVYVFVTVSSSQQVILRYRDVNSHGVEGMTILGGLPTKGVNHNGGALGVGPDARLYWAIGDNGSKRGVDGNLTNLNAKVGRANLDGSRTAANPFSAVAQSTTPSYIWATGFRNPFAMAFQPRTGKLWLNVVGSSPEGTTVPLTTPGYEQIFSLTAGEDGGWDDFEGNQPNHPRYITPFPRPMAHPVVQYKTDYSGSAESIRSITAISRQNGLVTVALSHAHPFRVGQIVQVANTEGFNAPYLVKSLVGTNGFTASSPGEETTGAANRGIAFPAVGVGCVSGGCFYESTSFPTATRGAYYFGDFNAGSIYELQLDADSQPVKLSRLVTGAHQPTGLALARDGSLLYADYGTNSIRRVSYSAPSNLLVTPTHFRLLEGGHGIFTVRLPSPPVAPVSVIVAAQGSSGVSIAAGSSLSFTPDNWNVPQPVTLAAAADDSSTTDGAAEFTVSADGYATETVQVEVTDITERLPAVSVSSLQVNAGGKATLDVTLPVQPWRSVTLAVRRTGPNTHVRVTKGGALVFTRENWNVPKTVEVTATAISSTDKDAKIQVSGRMYFPRTIPVAIQGFR